MEQIGNISGGIGKSKSGKYRGEDEVGIEQKEAVAVHSQVRKIKRESEEIMEYWSPGQPEMRRVLRDITRHNLSRSPLGLSGRPISVGDL